MTKMPETGTVTHQNDICQCQLSTVLQNTSAGPHEMARKVQHMKIALPFLAAEVSSTPSEGSGSIPRFIRLSGINKCTHSPLI